VLFSLKSLNGLSYGGGGDRSPRHRLGARQILRVAPGGSVVAAVLIVKLARFVVQTRCPMGYVYVKPTNSAGAAEVGMDVSIAEPGMITATSELAPTSTYTSAVGARFAAAAIEFGEAITCASRLDALPTGAITMRKTTSITNVCANRFMRPPVVRHAPLTHDTCAKERVT
jgi:hypothetical protein